MGKGAGGRPFPNPPIKIEITTWFCQKNRTPNLIQNF